MELFSFSFVLFLSSLIQELQSQTLPGCPYRWQRRRTRETGEDSLCGDENFIYVEDSFPTSIEECSAACKATVFCKFFTLNSQTGREGTFSCGLRNYETNGIINVPQFQKLGTKEDGLLDCDQKVLVGKTVLIKDGGSSDCQRSCQDDEKCNSWTWNKIGGLNPEVCVHNYGITVRKLFVGPQSNVVSGPQNCEGVFLGPGLYSNRASEVIDVPSYISVPSCRPPKVPWGVPTWAYMLGKQDLGITLCGGYSTTDCWVLAKNGTWLGPPTVKPMGVVKAHAASVQLGNEWWFTGGKKADYTVVASTKILAADGSWRDGVDLPRPMTRHCLVKLNSTHVFLTGGSTNERWTGKVATAYIYDNIKSQWTKVADMAAVRADHGCALLSDGRVIVGGGTGFDGKRPFKHKRTEIFSFETLSWTSGPSLPFGLAQTRMATIGTTTLLFGGSGAGGNWNSVSDAIYKIDTDTFTMTEVGQMDTQRYFHDLLTINYDECSGW